MVATTLNSEHRGLTWAGSVGLGWALAWAAVIDFQARTSRKQTLRAPSQYHLSCWKAKWLYDEVRKGVLTEQLQAHRQWSSQYERKRCLACSNGSLRRMLECKCPDYLG